MNFRQFDYFLAVARSGSLTAASVELGVAQPTLTKSMRALELELGVPLFDREPRGVVLTSFGLALRRHAERIRVQMEDAVEEIENLRGGESGPICIGAGPSWLRRLLPEAVAKVASQNPAMRVNLVGGYEDVLLKALREGEIDFVVAELPARENARDLELAPLVSDILGACARAEHPLAKRRQLRLRDLLAFPWVIPPSTTRAHQRLIALFTAADLPNPEVIVETESMAFQLQLVANSDALTFAVSTTLRLAEASGIAMLKVPELAARRSAGIITRKGGWVPPVARLVIEELRSICADEPQN